MDNSLDSISNVSNQFEGTSLDHTILRGMLSIEDIQNPSIAANLLTRMERKGFYVMLAKSVCLIIVRHVKHSDYEANDPISLSIVDYKSQIHEQIGTAELKIADLVQKCPSPIITESSPITVVSTSWAIKLLKKNAKIPAPASILNIRISFFPYTILRRNLFIVLLKFFDANQDGRVNQVELTTMLDAIGSTLSDDSIKRLFLDEETLNISKEITLEVAANSLESCLTREANVNNSSPTSRGVESNALRRQYQDEQIIDINDCPICMKKIRQKNDIDVVSHVALCAHDNLKKIDNFFMGGFSTEVHFSQNWFTKTLSIVAYQDSRNGPGRNKAEKQGKKFTDPSSKEEIGRFIAFHNIVIDEIHEPLSSFSNFNEFFYRRLKAGARLMASSDTNIVLSPVDARMCCYPTVSEATKFWIKGTKFSLKRLFADDRMASLFEGGGLAIFRLAPQDYHRFHAPLDGVIKSVKRVNGAFYTVANVAVRSAVDVFTENERVVILLEATDDRSELGGLGMVAMVCIGSLFVGSVNVTAKVGQTVKRMEDLGGLTDILQVLRVWWFHGVIGLPEKLCFIRL
ncbi:hypothetical protein HDU67_000993 [Dinochytrium kinnereticum]|nr:hypothetical protein HDU67_000993 [Dinochytrium kinnereticum]